MARRFPPTSAHEFPPSPTVPSGEDVVAMGQERTEGVASGWLARVPSIPDRSSPRYRTLVFAADPQIVCRLAAEPSILVATSSSEAHRLWRELDVGITLVVHGRLGTHERAPLGELSAAFAARFPGAPAYLLGPDGLEHARVAQFRGLHSDEAVELTLRWHRAAAAWRQAQLAASQDFCAQYGLRGLLATRAQLHFHMIPPELIATMLEQTLAGGRSHLSRLQSLVGESTYDGLIARMAAFVARRGVRPP